MTLAETAKAKAKMTIRTMSMTMTHHRLFRLALVGGAVRRVSSFATGKIIGTGSLLFN